MLNVHSFTYADPNDGPLKRFFIRSIEVLTGQLRIWRLYRDYQSNPSTHPSFWDAAMSQLELTLDYDADMLNKIPKQGPVVIVANHPFGVLDGLVINKLVSQARKDYKVLTNSVLYKAPEVRPFLLPVDFSGTREAMETNLNTRAAARDILAQGGCVVVFPAGGISTVPKWFYKFAVDAEWQPFISKLIMDSKATVVPMFFEGQNSRIFQVASHISLTLRIALCFKELSDYIGRVVRINIGAPIPYNAIEHIRDRKELAHFLKKTTYDLGPYPLNILEGQKFKSY